MRLLEILPIGFAIFTMLFGAGNVVFPLELGRDTGAMVWFALVGLVITGVMVPLLGLVSSALYNGDYKKFFGSTGKIPGFFLSLICMLLIGPFGATPRCITVAYASVQWHLPKLSLFIFSLFVGAITLIATLKKRYIVELFGRVLGPIKILLLLSIIILGLLSPTVPKEVLFTPFESFLKGFKEGYWTLDLLGTIFFSGLIVSSIRLHKRKDNLEYSNQEVAKIGLKAGLIGGVLLGIVYGGFCLLAAKLSGDIQHVGREQLLSALATFILGDRANILANTTVALACLTTAIALTAVFADYVAREIFFGRIKYRYALLFTVFLNVSMANLGFVGVSKLIEPVAVMCYPALIVLSVANLAFIFWKFKYTKFVTLSTLIATIFLHFIH